MRLLNGGMCERKLGETKIKYHAKLVKREMCQSQHEPLHQEEYGDHFTRNKRQMHE